MTPSTCEELPISQTEMVGEVSEKLLAFLDDFQQRLSELKRTSFIVFLKIGDQGQLRLVEPKRTEFITRFMTTGDEGELFRETPGTYPFAGDMLIWSNRTVRVYEAPSIIEVDAFEDSVRGLLECYSTPLLAPVLNAPSHESTAQAPRADVLSDERLAPFRDEPQRVLSELSKADAIELARQLEGALSPRADAGDILKDARRTLSQGLSSRY